MLVVLVCCRPTTVAVPAVGEMVWLRGADTCGQRSNLEGGIHTRAATGKHLLDRDSLGLENLGGWRPGLLGRASVVGKATSYPKARPSWSITCICSQRTC